MCVIIGITDSIKTARQTWSTRQHQPYSAAGAVVDGCIEHTLTRQQPKVAANEPHALLRSPHLHSLDVGVRSDRVLRACVRACVRGVAGLTALQSAASSR